MRTQQVQQQQKIEIYRGKMLVTTIHRSVTLDSGSQVTGMVRYEKMWKNAYYIPSQQLWKVYL